MTFPRQSRDPARNGRRAPHLASRIAKRVIDVAGSAAVLAATAPVLGAAALLVLGTMGTPVLFRQRRPGWHGVPFEVIKFRTMRLSRSAGVSPQDDAARLVGGQGPSPLAGLGQRSQGLLTRTGGRIVAIRRDIQRHGQSVDRQRG